MSGKILGFSFFSFDGCYIGLDVDICCVMVVVFVGDVEKV